LKDNKDSSILVVDDDTDNLVILLNLLSNKYKVLIAKSAELALDILQENSNIHLILLDIKMPKVDGYQLCQQIKNDHRNADIPIIFVTSLNDSQDEAKGFQLGAVDYITKPITPEILLSRVQTHISLFTNQNKLQQTIKSLQEREQDLKIAKAELEKLAATDPLTQLHNRRFFMKFADNEFYRFKRYQHYFSIIMIDLDFFKKINDSYGHLGGDTVLISFSKMLKDLIRSHETIARYGGEEFILLLPETVENGAIIVAERIRTSLEQLAIPCADSIIKVTASIGVTSSNTKDKNLQQIINRADQALYQAKENGRNKVTYQQS